MQIRSDTTDPMPWLSGAWALDVYSRCDGAGDALQASWMVCSCCAQQNAFRDSPAAHWLGLGRKLREFDVQLVTALLASHLHVLSMVLCPLILLLHRKSGNHLYHSESQTFKLRQDRCAYAMADGTGYHRIMRDVSAAMLTRACPSPRRVGGSVYTLQGSLCHLIGSRASWMASLHGRVPTSS